MIRFPRLRKGAELTLMAGALAGLLSQACTVTEGPIDDGGGLSDPGGPVSVTDCGTADVGDPGEEFEFEVPAGAQSFALVVEGIPPQTLMVADLITSPSGEVVFDFQNDIVINRTDAVDVLYTALVPTNPAVAVEEGDWVLNLFGDGSFEGELTCITKNQAATDRLIDLNLYFVGLDGVLDATTAETDETWTNIMANVNAIYSSAGIGVRAITYNDLSNEAYAVIDNDAELQDMFASVGRSSEVAINMFLVADLEGTGGFTLLGKAGGVPGPPVMQGTARSGVAISMADYLAAVAAMDQTMIDEAAALTELIMAHETGHFLGLYHTSEKEPGLGHDPLSDTSECDASADVDMDMTLSAAECGSDGGNLMFWSPLNVDRALTSSQGSVMLANPLVH